MKYIKLISLLTFFLLTSSNYSQKIKVIETMNLDLNSEYAEIGIKYLKNNKVLFASSKKNNSGKKRDKRNNRHMGLRLYTASIMQNGEVSNVKLFNEAESNPINESNITFTSDYKTVYFTRNNYIQDEYRKQFKKDTLDNHILKLFKASINSEGVLSNITPLPINNASYSVTNPQLSPDNKKLYFISDMKSSYGSFDIYEIALHADGTYGKPKNLGGNINSKGTEMFPYVTEENILYYASDGHGGLGELDIFSISLDKENATPINLGSPINSKKDDFSFIYNTNNLMGYFASNRKGGNGGADLYSFIVEPDTSEDEEEIAVITDDPTDSEVAVQITEITIEDSNTIVETQTKNSINEPKGETIIEEQSNTKETSALIGTAIIADNSNIIDNEEKQEENINLESNQDSSGEIKSANSKAETSIIETAIIADISNSKEEDKGINNGETIISNSEKTPSDNSKKSNSHIVINSTIITTDDSINKNVENELLLIEPVSVLNDGIPIDVENEEKKEIITLSTLSQNSADIAQNNQEAELDSTNLVEFKEELKIAEIPNGESDLNVQADSIKKDVAAIEAVSENKIEKCVQIVEGLIMNPSNTTLNNATVTVYENGKNIGTYDVSPEGKYSLELKCNYHYRITARLNKFEETYFELRTNQFSGSIITTNIVLKKIPCDILITGQFRDSKTNTPISNVKLYLIQENGQAKATNTKSDGTYTFKANCDEEYQINTDKFGYEESLFDINKSSVNNTTITFNATLKPLKCVQVLNGRITDLNTGQPLINITVDLIDKKGNLKETSQSNTNGNYHFTIDCDEIYTVNVTDKFYESASSNFKGTSENKQVNRLDIPIKSLVCIQIIDGIVLNSRTKVPMANVEVSLLKDGVTLETKTSPLSGIFSFEVVCETNYTVNVSSKDYYDNSKEIITSNVRNATVDFSIKLLSKLDFDLVRGEMMIIIEPIDFDLNESEIRDDTAIELTKIVNAMNKNPNVSVDIGVHTDSRAPDIYNMELSEERAQSIMNYIISRGINTSRLSGKGYGETQLLNKCTNGVKCTEEEHLVNRRIEFKVNQ